MQDLAFAIPGVDEAMGFAEIMKCASTYFEMPRGGVGGRFADMQTRQIDGILSDRV